MAGTENEDVANQAQKPGARVRRDPRPFLEHAGGETRPPTQAARAESQGSGAGSGPGPRASRNTGPGGRRLRLPWERSLRTKRKGKRRRLQRKGRAPSYLPFLLSPTAQDAPALAHPPALLTRSSTAQPEGAPCPAPRLAWGS